jgi:hypothetical protein
MVNIFEPVDLMFGFNNWVELEGCVFLFLLVGEAFFIR